MKYYKGTRKKKKSSKSKLSSSESLNTSNSVEAGNEVSRDETTINSQSSSPKKKNVVGRKRPSSSSSLMEKQRTGQTKRTKTKHTTPEEESNKNRKTNTDKHPDSSDDNEPKTSSNRKKRYQSTTARSSTRGSRIDEPSRKKVKSSDITGSNSSSIADTRRETIRNVYGTVQKKSSRKTELKPTAPNSPKSDSSETAESVFEDDEEEIQPTDRRGESENNFEVSSGGDISSDGVILCCSEFLQQQVRILKSEFEIEDCPELAAHLEGTKRQQKNHIPKEIVLKVLRKLNFKVEDELLKSLNRQAQRKILKQVDKIRSSYGMTGKKTSNEENTGQEPEGKVEELREALETSTAELDGLKRLTAMTAKIESMAEGFSTNSMVEEIKRTNKLVKKLNQKVRKEGFTNTYQETLTTKGPLSHQEIVNKLFS